MPVYLISHPNYPEIGTAKVEAPTTEKSRTTFLDYLERTGKVSRSARQMVRRGMITGRLEDPDSITADVDLSYEYGVGDSPLIGRALDIPLDTGYEQAFEPVVQEQQQSVQQRQLQEQPKTTRQLSPIARASLGVR